MGSVLFIISLELEELLKEKKCFSLSCCHSSNMFESVFPNA